MLFSWPDTPTSAASYHGGIYVPYNMCFLNPPDSASQTASRLVQPFFTANGRESPYLTICVKKLIPAIHTIKKSSYLIAILEITCSTFVR